jgi:hypothetical protein
VVNLKDKLTSILGYSSIVIAVVQAVMLAYNAWLATATSNPSVAEYIQLAILIVVGVIGVFTGKNPNGSTKSATQVAEQNAQAK